MTSRLAAELTSCASFATGPVGAAWPTDCHREQAGRRHQETFASHLSGSPVGRPSSGSGQDECGFRMDLEADFYTSNLMRRSNGFGFVCFILVTP
jgi:hypothetical protein